MRMKRPAREGEGGVTDSGAIGREYAYQRLRQRAINDRVERMLAEVRRIESVVERDNLMRDEE